MAYTTIDDPSAYFQTLLYTGDGNDNRNLVNTGNSDLQPDWIWNKRRDNTGNHFIFDSSRGVSKIIVTDTNEAESTNTNQLQAFQTDGFQLGSDNGSNGSSRTMVAWQWKANGGTTTSFTESGDNPGGTYQANQTAGFSIVRFIGTGANGTVQHGLGVAPQVIIHKRTDSGSSNWITYHNSIGTGHNVFLNLTNAKDSDGALYFQNTAPTSSVFTAGGYSQLNENDSPTIAYCFAPIQGYSKFGSYTGNGNADGPFIYTGFKPAWVMIKRTDSTSSWHMWDNKREDYDGNPNDSALRADADGAENDTTDYSIDFLSNGFKLRNASDLDNNSSGTFIYMAFAESPFVSSEGVPTTAR